MAESTIPKLIVVLAFDRGDDGVLGPAFDPVQYQDEDRARRAARALAGKHAGVIAWSRVADIALGDYGEPLELARFGDIPDMD